MSNHLIQQDKVYNITSKKKTDKKLYVWLWQELPFLTKVLSILTLFQLEVFPFTSKIVWHCKPE